MPTLRQTPQAAEIDLTAGGIHSNSCVRVGLVYFPATSRSASAISSAAAPSASPPKVARHDSNRCRTIASRASPVWRTSGLTRLAAVGYRTLDRKLWMR